jgi:hypothetical protein
MKLKKSYLPIFLALCFTLISWGYTGHRTIGLITEQHLNPAARLAIKDLLGDTSIAEACTWADDARRDPKFRNTAPWHFLNLPLGLTYESFKKAIDTVGKDNIYHALLAAEQKLKDKTTTRQERIYALKFVMHLVGDLHQPMHISRAEDKGGNTVQLNYEKKGTNLHSLWDTKLLEQEGLTFEQLGEKYKNVSPSLVKKWQHDNLLQWVWESYQISSQLYAEIDSMGNRSIGEAYYRKHLPTIERRLQQAGVRLAGILNNIYHEKQVRK